MTPPPPAAVPIAAWLGTWSHPPDRPAQVALALAVALLILAVVPRGPRWLASVIDLSSLADLTRSRRFLTVASFAAAFLSLGYIAFYLRGGPRAPEASTYWLQGRALSHGALAWTIPDPTASFRTRDLLFRAPDRLSGIFPPGYPLLLAMGFLVGAPMLVGPVLAAALVVATWMLAHEVVADAGGTRLADRGRAEAIARAAAGLSVVSAALRYHTADALPHGAAAVAVAFSLACALRARRTHDARLFGASGVSVGFLIASLPASAASVGIVVAILAWSDRGRARSLAWLSMAALPGLLLLLAANRAATGHAFVSAARLYAAAIGDGSHAVDAAPFARSALRCARAHLQDIANLEPLALLAVVPLLRSRASRGILFTALVIAGQIAARVLAGKDAAAASTGADLLVAIVPLEQVLIAIGVARLCPRAFAPAAVATLALGIAGFAVHASYAHEALAASDLGRPHYEPDVLREANVTHGLLFLDDDTGFALAYDPAVGASHGIQAARIRGDDHDRLLYDSLGHPAAHHYVMGATGPSVVAWAPPNAGSDIWRFEAESDWPPLAQGALAEVVDAVEPCASEGRVLRVTPRRTGPMPTEATATLDLPLPPGPARPETHGWLLAPRVLQRGDDARGALSLVLAPGLPALAEWTWGDSPSPPRCIDLPAKAVQLGAGVPRAWLVVRAEGGPVWIDKTTLRPN